MDKDLRVGVRNKPVICQIFFKREKIIHFPVICDPDVARLVRHGLFPPLREIDDRKTGMAKADLFIGVKPPYIRTAVVERVHHLPDKMIVLKTEKATNPAHAVTCFP